MIKNITLSADEELIQKAREKARQEHKTLHGYFRQWLKQYVINNTKTNNYFEFMDSLNYARPGRIFTREERNDR